MQDNHDIDTDCNETSPITFHFSKESGIDNVQAKTGMVSFEFGIEGTPCLLQIKKYQNVYLINAFQLFRVGLKLEKAVAWTAVNEILTKRSKEPFVPAEEMFNYIANGSCSLETPIKMRLRLLLKYKSRIVEYFHKRDLVYNAYLKTQQLLREINTAAANMATKEEGDALSNMALKTLRKWVKSKRELPVTTNINQMD